MRIVDRKTFLAMPAGTVFSKYWPCIFDGPNILIGFREDTGYGSDIIYQDIQAPVDQPPGTDYADQCGKAIADDVPLVFDKSNTSRDDDCGNNSQLFAVWSRQDVAALIARLTECLAETGT